MNVAILSESHSDEAVVRILVDAVLGRETAQPNGLRSPRHRGWPAVKVALPAVYRAAYYQTDAVGLVIVVDSNSSPMHVQEHEGPNASIGSCRICQLREILRQATPRKPRPSRLQMRVALGLAVPSLEAWLRYSRDPSVSEAAWIEALGKPRSPYSKQKLKRDVYGSERYALAHQMQVGVTEAKRIAEDLSSLEKRFPSGFGLLARTLRGWDTGEPNSGSVH